MEGTQQVLDSIAAHDLKSDERTFDTKQHISEALKFLISKDTDMNDISALAPFLANMGKTDQGLGGGMVGGLLLGTLLNRGGLLGGAAAVDAVGGGGVVTPTMLTAALAGVTNESNNNTIQTQLAQILAAIPANEGLVQLALSQTQADINNNISNHSTQIIAGQSAINKNIADTTATVIASNAAVKEAVMSMGTANLTATLNSKFELANAIKADGDQTRALIQSLETASTNRLLGERQDEIIELRNAATMAEQRRGVEITMINNQNQNQLQFQQQQQTLSVLANTLASVGQLAQATNQTIQIGNHGSTRSTSTANPTNVHA